MTFGVEKLGLYRMMWLYARVKKMKTSLFVSTEYTNVTDGRTPHDGIGVAKLF